MGTTDAMVPQPEQGAQALSRRDSGGVMELALMSEQDFGARLAALKKGQERVRLIQRELMTEDEDFGKIPGTPKPTLLKPGAEKLCNVYGLVPSFEDTITEGDGETRPHLRVKTKCFLHRGSTLGPVVGEGVGAANSWEAKHRYRAGKRTCPACGSEGTIRKSKYPDRQTGDIGWWCKDENCKTNFRSDDPAITEQVVGTIENPDPYDTENTLYKMSLKRSFIDATLRATATSGLFTQDLEDDGGDSAPKAKAPPPASKPATKPAGPRTVDAEVVETHDGRAFEVEPSGRLDPGKPAIPADGSPAWKDPGALAAECMRLAGGLEGGKALLKKITGADTAKGMPASVVLSGWDKLANLYAAEATA